MIKHFFCVLCFAVLLPFPAVAQLLKGHVENERGQRIAHAGVYIKNIKQGISANANGDFEMKLPAGTYTLVVQCLGYAVQQNQITLPQAEDLRIVLADKPYQLPEVVVNSGGEDQAVVIMRHAIAMAPYYRNAVKAYTADVYLKSKIHVDQIKGIAGLAVKKEYRKKFTNATILLESVNEIKFTAPNNYEHRIKSMVNASTINLKELGTDFNTNDFKMGFARFNLYQEDPSSPLSTVAFSNYKFTYQGCIEAGDRMVNKIKVTPRRKSQTLSAGFLYIVDNSWDIYSFDLLWETSFGTVRVQQNYGDVGHNIFLPVSYNTEINLSFMGAKGDGNMVGSIKYQDVTPNKKLERNTTVAAKVDTVRPKTNPKKEKLQEEVAELLGKEELKMRDMRKAARLQQKISALAEQEERDEKGEKKSLEIQNRHYKFSVDSNVRRNDTTFWNAVRPVPLVPDEIVTYHKNDSIIGIPAVKDTTPKPHKKNKFWTVSNDILFGHTYRIDSSLHVTFNGLIGTSEIDYNVVNGYVYGLGGSLNKRLKKEKRLQVNAYGAWAFSREAFMWETSVQHDYAPKLRAYWKIEGGQHTKDFAGADGVGMVNLFSTILFRVNYAAFYLDNFIRFNHCIDLANGLELYTGLQWSDRREMQNNTDHSYFFTKTREFRPNIPRNAAVAANQAVLADQKAALTEITLRYTPQYHYRMRGARKIMVRSDYPTFSATWKKGVPNVFNSTSNFDFLQVNITQTVRFGYFQKFTYFVETGKFFNTQNLAFADFKHFYTNDAGFSMNHDISSGYQLLSSYTQSTNDGYAAAKLQYTTPYLLLKRLPFLEAMLFDETLYGAYLWEPVMQHYIEIGYGISLSDALSVGLFAGYNKPQDFLWGIRGAIRLD